jgi:hypothetical protein
MRTEDTMENRRERIAAVLATARSFFPVDFLSQLEAHFYQTPAAVLGVLWAMADMAGQSRSEPGRQWQKIASDLEEAGKAAANLGQT